MSDLSFNIVALDKATMTMERVAGSVEKVSDKLDRLDRKEVTANVNVKTDESSKALDSFSTRFQLLAGAIVAASPVAGAAIVAGIGAGFIGVAAAAVSSNEEVKSSFRNMTNTVVAETKGATQQLVPQFVAAGNAITVEARRLEGDLKKAFTAAGPDIVALTNSVTSFAHNAMPGMTSAMQNSLPVFVGVENLSGKLGTTFGTSVQSMGQHASQYGTVLTSVGSITDSVVTNTTHIVNDLGDVWAANAGEINGAIGGITGDIAGLAHGVLPVLSAGLDVAATAVHTITDALGPLAPVLGFVAAAAGATWVAMKAAGLVTAGVNALATGVLNAGAAMETGAARAATFVAAQQAVAVESSVAAVAVRGAGAAAATGAVGFAAAASTIAGPLGIALIAGTVLLGLFSSGEDKAKISTDDLTAANNTLTSALQSSHGAFTQQAVDALKSTDAFKKLAKDVVPLGISQGELVDAITKGGPALDALNNKLAYYSDFLARVKGNADHGEAIGEQAKAARAASEALAGLVAQTGSAIQAQRDNSAAAQDAAQHFFDSGPALNALGVAAAQTGLPLDSVARGLKNVVASGQAAASDIPGVAAKFVDLAIKIAAAQDAISDHFAAADKAVSSAKSAVADASYSYQQSLVSIRDAEHSAANASRALADAKAGVATATASLAKAQEAEKKAEDDLHVARQRAVQDLKDLHLQLEGQVLSEEQARVRLFEAEQSAAAVKLDGQSITPNNAKDIAGLTVNAKNLSAVKAAQDLVSAQNALNDTLNSGVKLRDQVSAADKAGIEGSEAVTSAQRALTGAHEQVISAQQGVARAQQQVTDAAYSEQKAHQAVTDAQHQSATAAGRLADAKTSLRIAQENATRSLDINSAAGRENLRMLNELSDAIDNRFGKTQEGYKAKVDAVATAFGLSKDAAAAMLEEQGKIPPDFKYNVTAVAGVDQASWATLFAGIGQKTTLSAAGLGGGTIHANAEGGPIFGPGGPKDDSILSWVSNGEWVQPADAVSHYGHGFMEAVRTKRFPRGGDGAAMPRFADGGLVDTIIAGAKLSMSGAAYQSAVHALDINKLPHPDLLPKYVPPPPSAYMTGVGGLIGYTPSAGVAQWSGVALNAMGQLGIPADYLSAVLRRMQQESGGNPNIVNKWDSNWIAGHPSVGLMQVIGPTFASNAGPYGGTGPFSYGVSVDPLANTYAGLNYAGRRYGGAHGGFVGGVLYAMNKPGGYDSGGWLQPGITFGMNATGRPEAVLTPRESEAYVTHAKRVSDGKPSKSVVNHFNVTINVQNQDQAREVRRTLEQMAREAGV